MIGRINKTAVDSLNAPEGKQVILWDNQLLGFGVKASPGGTKGYFINYRDWNGRQRRHAIGRHGVFTPDEARAAARKLLNDIAAGIYPASKDSGAEDDSPRPVHPERGMTVAEACRAALESSKRGERGQRDWHTAVAKFEDWRRSQNLPEHWRELTRADFSRYQVSMQHLAANTQRLALQPLIQTGNFLECLDYPNPVSKLKIGSKLAKTPPAVYLQDVAELVGSIEGDHFRTGIMLQGLCGLQLGEALRLTWDRVDVERGLIEISGEVKNDYRERVIPVPGIVREELARAKANHARRAAAGGVIEVPGYVVTGLRGEGFDDPSSYSRRVRAILKNWNSRCDWTPKDLRNCLPTFAMMEGIHGMVWEQYIGHAPGKGGVSATHYVPRLGSPTAGEAAALQKRMDIFRRLVVQPVEEALARFAADAAAKAGDATGGKVVDHG